MGDSMQSSNVNLDPNIHFSICNEREIEYFSTYVLSAYEFIQQHTKYLVIVVVVFWTDILCKPISNFCWNFISLMFFAHFCATILSRVLFDSFLLYGECDIFLLFFLFGWILFRILLYFFAYHAKKKYFWSMKCWHLFAIDYAGLFLLTSSMIPKYWIQHNNKKQKKNCTASSQLFRIGSILLNKETEITDISSETLNLKWLNSLDNIFLVFFWYRIQSINKWNQMHRDFRSTFLLLLLLPAIDVSNIVFFPYRMWSW